MRIRSLLGFLIAVIVWQMGTPLPAHAERKQPPLKAAFIREGHLWLKSDAKEVQVTHEGRASEPQWSPDGKWVAFFQKKEIWAYNVDTKKLHRVMHAHGSEVGIVPHDIQWSPAAEGDKLAFLDGDMLDVVDLTSGHPTAFENVANGVSSYTWLRTGEAGFLTASRACMQPDGWTSPIIYKIPLAGQMGLKKIEPFFTIPRTVKVRDTNVYSFQVSGFKWSGNFDWIAFLVSGTASMSMDENALCVLSADGKTFQPIDVVLPYSKWFQWSPFPARLGYIAGGGRVVIEPGKELAIRDVIEKEDHFSHSTSLLPMRVWPSTGRPFTFGNDGVNLYVSLDKTYVPTKTPWLDRPHPALYRLILIYDRMIQMTSPPAGWGDVNPHYLMRRHELIFVRTDGKRSDVWICKSDGQGARQWIANIEDDVVIYGEPN